MTSFDESSNMLLDESKTKENLNTFSKDHSTQKRKGVINDDSVEKKAKFDAPIPTPIPVEATEGKSKKLDFDDFNRKRKVALFLSYCGAHYHGMQKNPDVETIEKKLVEALCAIDAITLEHKTEYLNNVTNSLSFQRAARTDKGVSAARQLVSLKVKAKETFIEDINAHLPNDIRVFGIERVTKKFDSKCSCSGRNYEYLVPSLAFAPSKDIYDTSYRLPEEQLERVNQILSQYVGTHNFHNFTSGKQFVDKSACRYITSFKANQPFLVNDHEFITLEVAGQSFMIHQIRKMIGLCIAICRGYTTFEYMNRCWKDEKLDIPKAPGLGLLLNRIFFHQYDKKRLELNDWNPLTFEETEVEVERFKTQHIWKVIIDEEVSGAPFIEWLKTLGNHSYSSAGMKKPERPEEREVHLANNQKNKFEENLNSEFIEPNTKEAESKTDVPET